MVDLLTTLAGLLAGLLLGLTGGGGSVLAVPLLVYWAGAPPHVAIGTGALAVAVSAAISLAGHWRIGVIKWRCGLVFAAAGVLGALGGAALAKQVDGTQLLTLFGGLMIVVGVLMFLKRSAEGEAVVRLTRMTAPAMLPWLTSTGFGAGALSGFFGIGGGFLIVPALRAATQMTVTAAIGTSLIAVTSFGAATAASYAAAGLVDVRLAAFFVLGGAVGGIAGQALGQRLSGRRGLLAGLLAGLIFVVGLYVLVRGLAVLF